MKVLGLLVALVSSSALAQECFYMPVTTCADGYLGKKTFWDGIVVNSIVFTDGGTVGGGGSGASTVAPVGASPNDAGGVISGSTLTLQPADSTHPGVVAGTGSQTLAPALTLPQTLTLGSAVPFQVTTPSAHSFFGVGTNDYFYSVNSSDGFLRTPDGIVASGDVYSGNLLHVLGSGIVGGAGSILVTGGRTGADVGSDVTFQATGNRTAGFSTQWTNNGGGILAEIQYPFGEVIAGINNSNTAAYIDGSAQSGHVSLLSQNGYVTLQGTGPTFADPALGIYYGAIHGIGMTVQTTNPIDAGFVAAFNGANRNGGSAVSGIDFRGGYTWLDPVAFSALDKCPANSIIVADDGGAGPCSGRHCTGQMYQGELQSSMQYTSDRGWVGCTASGWVPVLTQTNFVTEMTGKQANEAHSDAYFPGGSILADFVIKEEQYTAPAVARRISVRTVIAGSDAAHTYTVDINNTTGPSVMCVTSATACNAAVGTVTATCSSAIAAGDLIQHRVHTSACTGTAPSLNVGFDHQ